jgi:CRISPR-associated endonuclease/helicase Cas3
MVNRVRTALDVYDALNNAYSTGSGKKRTRLADAPDLRLVHSRFRGAARESWTSEFLHRHAELPPEGRIIVATQVVEAGVDISASLLVTELAPWPSLVQRFGRAARYEGDAGEIIVVGDLPATDKEAAPYSKDQLAASAQGLDRLIKREGDGSPRSLEAFEDELGKGDAPFLEQLYPYEPLHVLRRRDLDDLFDTSPDLSGADIDISRFIRTGEERDVTVFWRSLGDDKGSKIQLDGPPQRSELCPVPVADMRTWKKKAYVFDYIEGGWLERHPKHLVPGMTVLLDTADGGYSGERGWDPTVKKTTEVERDRSPASRLATTSAAEERDDLSQAAWKTIATHASETAAEALSMCERLGVPDGIARVVVLAARWHDVGKAHTTLEG